MKFNFSPSKEFKEKTKEGFLAAFDARYPASARPRPSEFVLALRALAIVLAVVVVTLGGTSVYADTANVPAESPLYPLKRLGETVQLALTLSDAKPQLEASFAARRAAEITDLETQHPTSTLLPRLANDLANSVNDSLNGAGNEGRHDEGASASFAAPSSTASSTPPGARFVAPSGTPPFFSATPSDNLKRVCGTLGSFLNPSSSLIKGGFLKNSDALRRFEDRCGFGNATSSPATTVPTNTPPTSAVPHPRFPIGRENFGNEGDATATPSATSTAPASFAPHGGNNGKSRFDDRGDL